MNMNMNMNNRNKPEVEEQDDLIKLTATELQSGLSVQKGLAIIIDN
jgi:hypothetical protein